jgi:hypothetical protein
MEKLIHLSGPSMLNGGFNLYQAVYGSLFFGYKAGKNGANATLSIKG